MREGMIRDVRALEMEEDGRLAPYAIRSTEAVRRRAETSPDEGSRLAFQRDRDRILHARAFRRLKHKTQVFVPHTADHPRTRLTHTLEVAQLGRTIARSLGLNEDLVEAVALGTDGMVSARERGRRAGRRAAGAAAPRRMPQCCLAAGRGRGASPSSLLSDSTSLVGSCRWSKSPTRCGVAWRSAEEAPCLSFCSAL